MKKQEFIEQYVENVKRILNTATNAYDLSDEIFCVYCPLRKECHLNGHCIDMLCSGIDDISEVEE